MPKRTGDFDAWLTNELTDPQLAASYVNAAISDDPDLLPVVLREVAKAHTMKKVAKDAGVARESLYTILSDCGNPTLTSLNAVLKAVRLKIAVVADSEESNVQESPPGPAVVDRLRIDSSVHRAIEGLRSSANISVAIPDIVGLFGVEPQPAIRYFSFKTQPGLGALAWEPVTPRTRVSGFRNAFEKELQEQSGVADSGKTALAPVETDVGQLAWQVGCGSQQLAP